LLQFYRELASASSEPGL